MPPRYTLPTQSPATATTASTPAHTSSSLQASSSVSELRPGPCTRTSLTCTSSHHSHTRRERTWRRDFRMNGRRVFWHAPRQVSRATSPCAPARTPRHLHASRPVAPTHGHGHAGYHCNERQRAPPPPPPATHHLHICEHADVRIPGSALQVCRRRHEGMHVGAGDNGRRAGAFTVQSGGTHTTTPHGTAATRIAAW